LKQTVGAIPLQLASDFLKEFKEEGLPYRWLQNPVTKFKDGVFPYRWLQPTDQGAIPSRASSRHSSLGYNPIYFYTQNPLASSNRFIILQNKFFNCRWLQPTV